MQNSNFSFLKDDSETLYSLCHSAELYLYTDPNTSMYKLRQFGETLARIIMVKEKIQEPPQCTQFQRLQILQNEGILDKEICDLFHTLRDAGNEAVHNATAGNVEEAKSLLRIAFLLATWYMEVYVDYKFAAPEYQEPKPQKMIDPELKQKYEETIAQLEEQLVALRKRVKEVTKETRQKRAQASRRFVRHLQLTEAETRLIIDAKLREAGWEADSQNLTYKKGVRPEKNRNLAIAEWPVKGGRVDYALFIGLQLVGIIEAKAKHKNVPSVLDSQTKTYAKQVEQIGQEIITPTTGDYKVPFLYATNGRPYLKQLEESSGIWFWDSRKPKKHARALEAWHSPEDLKALLAQDEEEAVKLLKEDDLERFGLREYQKQAIQAVEKGLLEGRRRMLVAMATGTGKTKTAIALMYRLIKSKMCRRILFLVDRNSLGQQTADALKDTKIDGYSFADIYDVKSIEHAMPELETKVHIATVQGMIRRLFYSDGHRPTVGQYDFIIVDEAHRGYTLDQEMSDEELLYRNQEDYVSQYRRVIEYFDATVLGLTATPALHTVEIFGHPIFKYSYSEAVVDGYLVDHEPPIRFKTKLQEEGIKFEKGEEAQYIDEETGEIRSEQLKDELSFDVDDFNKKVLAKEFNKAILQELTNYIDPTSEEKTLIFAVNDLHADLVVNLLKEAYRENGLEIEDDAIMKITGSIYKPLDAIKRFKNERFPNIVVTVDLLTTGVDVPKITNLVFLRRVRSRILYEQMLGRATRPCPEINKTCFRIYDAVGIYDIMQSYSEMKPVVKNVSYTLTELYNSLIEAKTKKEQEFHRKQLIAKIQRLKRRLNEERQKEFVKLAKGKTVDEWALSLKTKPIKEIEKEVKLIHFIEETEREKEPRKIYISNHADEIKGVTRGYGQGNERPEDYLDGFQRYIRENMNKIPALMVVCTRPQDLTRKDLRELMQILEEKGYSEKQLQVAWKDAKNEEIVANIISFIRQAALGDALIDNETRIKRAMQKVYALHNWTLTQKQWLERIEKQLLRTNTPILPPNPEEAFSEEPFKSHGGYRRLKQIFGDKIDEVVKVINQNLYAS